MSDKTYAQAMAAVKAGGTARRPSWRAGRYLGSVAGPTAEQVKAEKDSAEKKRVAEENAPFAKGEGPRWVSPGGRMDIGPDPQTVKNLPQKHEPVTEEDQAATDWITESK